MPGTGVRWSYGWVILVVSFLTLSFANSFRFSFGLFFSPIETEFGWDRTTLSAAVAINMIVFGLFQPVAGRLTDRFGPKRVIIPGLAMLGLGLMLLSQTRSAAELYLYYGVFVGVGIGGAAFVTHSALISRWFVRRRSLALSLGLSGGSAGSVVMVPTTALLLLSFGWRPALLILGAGVLVLLLPVSLLLVRDRPLSESAEAATASSLRDLGVSQATRTRPFWLLVGGFWTCGFTATLVSMHLPGHVAQIGLPPEVAATSLTLLGITGATGSMLAGFLSSRVQPRLLLAAAYFMRALGILVLLQATQPEHFVLFALINGAGLTATLPMTTSLTASAFGRGSMATIFGFVALGHQIGDAIGVLLGGVLYDLMGSYQIPFSVVFVLLLVATAFSLGVDDRATLRLRARPAA